jgi:hypothetical protein
LDEQHSEGERQSVKDCVLANLFRLAPVHRPTALLHSTTRPSDFQGEGLAMNARIYSVVVDRAIAIALATTASAMFCCDADAQQAGRFQTDPSTGIVYQPRTTTIERPVVETKMEQREQTIYRPQTVTETRPENRTTYSPVVEYKWEPRLHGRWNPFQRPTIKYHHVGRSRWEARNEVVNRTNTRTEYVAEKRTVEVPTRVVRMQREQKTDYVAVGRVAPKQNAPAVNTAIASRLRPLNSNESVAPIHSTPQIASTQSFAAPRIAASTVGRMTSDPPRRAMGQSGLRATTLAPGVRGQVLPSSSGGIGVAGLPSLPIFR